MSQKKEGSSPADKWRELSEVEEMAEKMVDDEHLLDQESNTADDETADTKLRDQLKVLEIQADFHKDQATRALAELENVRRRAEQDVSKARKFGAERLLSELIPVVDSLVRGLEGTVSDDPKVQTIRKGMELTLDIMNKLLEKHAVLPIDPKVGDVFDPAQHEAMSMRSEPGAQTNTILQVLQKGYSLHGRVLRAAMVIVAA